MTREEMNLWKKSAAVIVTFKEYKSTLYAEELHSGLSDTVDLCAREATKDNLDLLLKWSGLFVRYYRSSRERLPNTHIRFLSNLTTVISVLSRKPEVYAEIYYGY